MAAGTPPRPLLPRLLLDADAHLFGVGVGGSLAWMSGLAGVMIVEKTWHGGQRLAPFIGVACLLLAALWVVQLEWLGEAAA